MPDPEPYVTAEEVRAAVDGLNASDDPRIVAAVAEFEPIAERYLGVAFRPRTATFSGSAHRGRLDLPHRQVTEVTTLTFSGTAVTRQTDDLDADNGTIHYLHGRGSRYVATYTHGFTDPTPLVRAACIEYAADRTRSQGSGVSRNVLTQAFEGGTTRYSTPNGDAHPDGRPTGFLQVDALLNRETAYLVRIF